MTLADRIGEGCWNHMSRERLTRAARLARRSLATTQSYIVSVVDGAGAVMARTGCDEDPHGDCRIVEACCDVAAAASQPLVHSTPDAGRDLPFGEKDTGSSFVGVPVRLVDEVVGVVCATDVVPRRWSVDDIEGLVEIAESISSDMALKVEADARDANEAAARSIQARLLAIAAKIRDIAATRRAGSAVDTRDPLAAVIGDIVALAAGAERALPGRRSAAWPRGRESQPAVSHETEARSCGATILLADDLDLNRKLIADMLSLDGHRVDCVADGIEAVQAVAARHYDLVLMDMIMPIMDGIAATRAIRSLPQPAADVPIIALTANALQEQLDDCLDAGMNAALTKPMSLDALTATVAAWIRPRPEAS